MKRLIILIMILSSLGYSQELIVILDSDYNNRETKELLASLTTPISSSYAKTLDTFISMVKDSLAIANLSDAFDVMYDLGGETAEQSLKNLVKRQHDATAVNSPTFTQWEGFQGNGTSSYINTNYNDSTQGVAYTLNSASYGLYYLGLDNTDGIWDMGHYSGSYGSLIGNFDNDVAGKRVYVNSFFTSTTNRVFGLGLKMFSRINSTQILVIFNSVLIQTLTLNVSGQFNSNWGILAAHDPNSFGVFTTAKISFAFIGKGLSATEASKLTNCVEWLMDSKGKGVIP